MMRCRKGGGRWKKMCWRWKEKVIEKVKEFKYLGYTVRYDRRQEGHISERIRKGAALLGQVWGIGKRRFGGDWSRRVWLFDRLIWSVISYGVEVWGWREREGKIIRQISEMDVGGGEEDSRVYGKEGGAKGYVERESRVKDLEI
ncbi:myb-binding protein 1a [Lasius niger]|uniref:Myb-binding protein 1a n=1 Tax=Lasius niger TaxID=67767 RepID=A0A0J7JZ62_LASNI|nr:myb-binding protein 1a [Lasius niger]